MSLRRKALPGLTTLLAYDSEPIRDKRSLFLHALKPLQRLSCSLISANFSEGNLRELSIESISIPRKVRDVAGPTDLDGSTGRPAHSHVVVMIFMFLSHSLESGGPIVRKSSM